MDLPGLLGLRDEGIRVLLGPLGRLGGILGHRVLLDLPGLPVLPVLPVLQVRGCSIVQIHLAFLAHHCHWGLLVHQVH